MANVRFFLPVASDLVWQSFQLSISANAMTVIPAKLVWAVLQMIAQIGFSMNSRNALIREVLMFLANCSTCTGMSFISTFNKFSGISQCDLKSL